MEQKIQTNELIRKEEHLREILNSIFPNKIEQIGIRQKEESGKIYFSIMIHINGSLNFQHIRRLEFYKFEIGQIEATSKKVLFLNMLYFP